jgi:uncharacterized membrane protein YphA (DoxX/SURF4 family)
METVIWIAQGVLAGVFLMAGSMKLAQPKERLLAQDSMAWVEDFDERQIKGIGALEVLAAGGLILPAALDIAPVLTALAASGVVLLMLGAGATHLRRGELGMLPVNLTLAALALFVAIERFGPHSL